MNKLIIEKEDFTPAVVMDKEKGIFEICGKSLPEDAIGFYQPVIDWLEEYLKNPNTETVMRFELVYFNTASSKMFFEIVRLLDISYLNDTNIKVHWCFDEDDEDIQEAGEDFADLSKVPFIYSVLTE